MTADWPSKDQDKVFFPITTVGQLRKLFESQLAGDQPNLALLSIVVGFVENTLTHCKDVPAVTAFEPSSVQPEDNEPDDATAVNLAIDPPVTWDVVETLMAKFQATVRGFCDADLLSAVRTGAKDDYAVNARRLIKHVADIVWNTLSKSQYKDRPHLQSIYSYLTGNKLDCFGVAYAVVAACQLLEVNDVHLALSEDHAWVVFGDNETAEVTWHGKGSEDKRGQPVEPIKAKSSWLYVAGQPTVCSRAMEVAAMVSAINPAINSGTDSVEVGAVQQELLWLLYDLNHLQAFPMAIGNLGDLEEITPSIGRPHCSKLYEEAVIANQKHYSNHHVYPHTYQGGYYYRSKDYKKAIQSWANAANVIKLYNYSKDDEEIYKEFMEIANDHIPHIIKTQAGESNVVKDPETFANILKFYDGLCCWEAGSSTPILHIGWAKPMVTTMSKFCAEVRQQVAGSGDEEDAEGNKVFKSPISGSPAPHPSPSSSLASALSNVSPSSMCLDHECFQKLDVEEVVPVKDNNNYQCDDLVITSKTVKRCDTIFSQNNPKVIECLSQASHTHLLSLQYLLGRSQRPFDVQVHPLDVYSKKPVKPVESLYVDTGDFLTVSEPSKEKPLQLQSVKMKGLRSLLAAEKLNASAIQLQLTAQSQTEQLHSRPKRSRRE